MVFLSSNAHASCSPAWITIRIVIFFICDDRAACASECAHSCDVQATMNHSVDFCGQTHSNCWQSRLSRTCQAMRMQSAKSLRMCVCAESQIDCENRKHPVRFYRARLWFIIKNPLLDSVDRIQLALFWTVRFAFGNQLLHSTAHHSVCRRRRWLLFKLE